MFPSIEELLKYISSHSVKFIDFRFIDVLGKWHHITRSAETVDDNVLSTGLMFDSSSIKGWKPIEKSDMILFPDVSTSFIDPFTAQPTLVINCDIIDTENNQPYSRDPRSIAKKSYQYMNLTNIADKAFFGPEMEFFIFDDVRYHVGVNSAYFTVDSVEGSYNSGRKYDYGNTGHRPKTKGGYMPVPPVDCFHDIRSEMLTILSETGIKPLLHHHEVATSQCEIGFLYDELIASADNMIKSKYVIHNVANSYGKTVTFMPKPLKDDNGSGMHCHQSLWKNGRNIFSNDDGSLSEICLYYIGGILKHGKAINAFSNPTTNSYKRLVDGFEAPTRLSYSNSNRSAAIRIPYTPQNDINSKRIEVRFPDPLANPYLCFAAQLMAGLDGIKNKIHPGDDISKSFYTLNEDELKKFPSTAKTLEEALSSLDKDREFLLKNDVFTNEQIDSYIKIKRDEVNDLNRTPHPIEFINYYSS